MNPQHYFNKKIKKSFCIFIVLLIIIIILEIITFIISFKVIDAFYKFSSILSICLSFLFLIIITIFLYKYLKNNELFCEFYDKIYAEALACCFLIIILKIIIIIFENKNFKKYFRDSAYFQNNPIDTCDNFYNQRKCFHIEDSTKSYYSLKYLCSFDSSKDNLKEKNYEKVYALEIVCVKYNKNSKLTEKDNDNKEYNFIKNCSNYNDGELYICSRYPYENNSKNKPYISLSNKNKNEKKIFMAFLISLYTLEFIIYFYLDNFIDNLSDTYSFRDINSESEKSVDSTINSETSQNKGDLSNFSVSKTITVIIDNNTNKINNNNNVLLKLRNNIKYEIETQNNYDNKNKYENCLTSDNLLKNK